jgi:CO dehydrogenase maturation factor
MGRPEGSGCYCYANNVLKSVIGQIAKEYPYVMLDNEAGLENLSRRIVQAVDLLILVSDSGSSGLNTLKRLYDLANEMEIGYNKLFLVVNKIRGNTPAGLDEIKSYTNADLAVTVPDSPELAEFSEENKPLTGLPENNPLVKAADEIIANLT